MLLLYAVTLFVSATLLFLVQPMVGKMLLPLLGGTPAVWNTCMVFFQAVLLAGYAFAHASLHRLGPRRQAVLQLLLLPLPFLVLPIDAGKGWLPSADTAPVLAVLGLLLVSVGLPFFVVSTSAPVLQKWFADTGHPSAKDPYFLYGASNLGSMLALLSYPALIEPNLFLRNAAHFGSSQTHLWMVGYGLLVLLYLACALAIWRSPQPAPQTASAETPPAEAVTGRRRLRWVLLAFVPSSVMIGGTTYLTTDVAAIPLLWILPLSVYLLSFIFVFGRMPEAVHRFFLRVQPFVLLVLLLFLLADWQPAFWAAMALHLGGLFVVSMACHGELARDRPSTRDLTSFYLLMSLGGVLGGAFNGLLAPIIFPTLMEYPLVLVLACLLLPRGRQEERPAKLIWVIGVPLLLCVFCLQMFTLFPLLQAVLPQSFLTWCGQSFQAFAEWFGAPARHLFPLLAVGLALLICTVYVRRPARFAACIGAVVLAVLIASLSQRDVDLQARSFFAVHKVRRVEEHDPRLGGPAPQRVLHHGTTQHGIQWISDDRERRREALSYFHRTGPIGQLFKAFEGKSANWTIGIAGLGAGTIAAYGERGQKIVFYEIDDLVRRIAFDPRYFNYVDDAKQRGVEVSMVLGDARLTLDNPDQGPFDLLFLDAFSSDSLPLHLITQEAIRVYLSRLKPHGLLVFNISNRYVDLEPVLGNVSRHGDLGVPGGLTAIVNHDSDTGPPGKYAASWVVMARRREDLGALGQNLGGERGWRLTREDPRVGIWTDDFSNLLSVLGF